MVHQTKTAMLAVDVSREPYMANVFSPFGFRSFGQREGSAPTAGFDRLFIASSDANLYFTGDLVSLSSATTGTSPNTISLTNNTSGSIVAGVFAGCEYYSPSVGRVVWSSYFPGSVGSSSPCNAYVITNPQQLFIAQASTTSGVVGTSLINFGLNACSSLQASGNTLSGQSYLAIGSSTATIASSLSQFRVVDVYQNYAPPGVNGTSSGSEGAAILVLQPNNWMRNNLTAASS